MSWREILKGQWIREVISWTPWRRDCRSDKDLEVSTGTLMLSKNRDKAHYLLSVSGTRQGSKPVTHISTFSLRSPCEMAFLANPVLLY